MGLLVDSGEGAQTTEKCKFLLTIDLTQNVAEEAIAKKSNFIVAYHPFIFRGLKLITNKDPQQKSLLKLIKHNISVYSPHTAVDSAKGGVNDFLADGITEKHGKLKSEIIQPDAEAKDCGMGRIITLKNPVPLSDIVDTIKEHLNIPHVQVGLGRNLAPDHRIETVAICAGSGGSVFRGTEADLYYTGELSHHEALFFTESGSSIVVCNHSNTERAYLQSMKKKILAELPDAEVEISEKDKDPYTVW